MEWAVESQAFDAQIWDYVEKCLAYVMAMFYALVQWNGLKADEDDLYLYPSIQPLNPHHW